MAERVAGFGGNIAFVWVHVAVFAAWIVWNTWPGLPHFDSYPFIFLTLCVSLEAIFLSSFILISQNYEMRVTERRNRLDLQINLLAEQENTKVLQLLEGIARQLGVRAENDPDVQVLEQATRPETLVRQIDEAFRQDTRQSPAGDGKKPR